MTIPTGYAQSTISYVGAGSPSGAVNVLGHKLEVVMTPVEAAEIIRDLWIEHIMPELTNDVTLDGVRVKYGPDEDGPFGEVGASTAGAGALTSLTPNTAYLIGKVTGEGGRRGRGRMYIPGVAEVNVDDSGNVEAVTLAALATAVQDLFVDLQVAGLPIYLLHEPATEWVLVDGQPRRQALPGAVPTPTEVTTLTVSSLVATQRRRLRR